MNYPGDIRGVIFDMDGVLTNTIEFHYQSWQQLADEEGIPFDRDRNEALRGRSRRDSLMLILGDRAVSEAQIQDMMERKNRYFLELIVGMNPSHLLPGVGELLAELREAGVKTAIASASRNVGTVIDRLGIADEIDVVTTVYEVDRPKPAPDVFLYAARRLNLEPHQCIAIEDAESGVEAAIAAGMTVVGLGPVDRVGAANLVLSGLGGVRWRDLLDKLGLV